MALCFSILIACAGSWSVPAPRLLAGRVNVPDDVRAGCALAERRCTRCHPIDRVLATDVRQPAGWRRYVERMRHMPGSGIAASETEGIVRCLTYRSFGAKGMEGL